MEEKKSTPFKELFQHAAVAASILTAAAAYYSYNYLLLAAAAALAFLIYKYAGGQSAEKNTPGIYVFFGVFAVFFAAARFYRIFSYPADFIADEWNQILDAYYVLRGDKSLFDLGGRFGSSFIFLSEAVILLFLSVFRENIDSIRLIPAAAFVFTAAGMYFLGTEIKDKKTGLVFAFIYCTSGWALFMSKQAMENVYVPFFAVWFMFFLLRYINKKETACLAAAGLILLSGLFTYSSWTLMLVFAAYALIDNRKAAGKKAFRASLVFITACAVLYAALTLNNAHTYGWMKVYSVITGPDALLKIALNAANAAGYFTRPLPTTMSFVSTQPLYTFTEFTFLAGGVILAALNSRDVKNRLFLAGFIISLATLLISKNPDHNLRHALILPFGAVLSSLFMASIVKWRYFYILAVVHLLLTVNIFFSHYAEWGTQLNISGARKQAAEYINKNARSAYFFHDLISASHQPVAVRLKCAYGKRAAGKTVFIVNSLWRKGAQKLFPGAIVRYFHADNQGSNLALCVFEVKGPDPVQPFMEVSEATRSYCVRSWMRDPGWTLKQPPPGPAAGGPAAVFRQALIASYILEAYTILGAEQQKFEYAMSLPQDLLMNAETDFYLAVKLAESGRYDEAYPRFIRAAKAAPEWKLPRIWLAEYAKKGYK